MVEVTQTRRDEIQDVFTEYTDFYKIFGGLILLSIGFLFGMVVFRGTDEGFGYITNVYTEGISILVTVLILDQLNRWREDRREKKSLQERLIRQARSSVNAEAIRALEELGENSWIRGKDSLLKYKNLVRADLSGAPLQGANLEGVTLDFANLEDAILWGANLKDATLIKTNLANAKLQSVNFEDSNLRKANLDSAELTGANLTDADLTDANIVDVIWGDESLFTDNPTILPDGSRYKGSTDMTRFTNPQHAHYWQPPRFK